MYSSTMGGIPDVAPGPAPKVVAVVSGVAPDDGVTAKVPGLAPGNGVHLIGAVLGFAPSGCTPAGVSVDPIKAR